MIVLHKLKWVIEEGVNVKREDKRPKDKGIKGD